ncbi:hypothetical protein M569_15782 [Genlisea aurea]|uniref:PLATZ transcription factor family protein n=1 Tax=Genlisea aurea TaxID=192259 RepID=S8BXD7_9LAMI|nr:hypothetical protein M569_15782 [Genlisea aurea]
MSSSSSSSFVESLQWLSHWLQLGDSFYSSHCRVHPSQYHTQFCCDCMGPPFCHSCNESSTPPPHSGHSVLTMCKASGRAAIHFASVAQYLNVSAIQLYIFNGKRVVNLNPNPTARNNGGKKKKNPHVSCCEYCGAKLMDPDVSYCSISCKTKCVMREEGDGIEKMKPERRRRQSTPPPEKLPYRFVPTRRKRKKPERAPLM